MFISADMAEPCCTKENLYASRINVVPDPTKPVSLKINLSPRARAIVEGVREDAGIASTEMMERILEWYASVPPTAQLAIINRNEAKKSELARIALGQLAAADSAGVDLAETPVSIDDAGRAAKMLIEKMMFLGRSYENAIKQEIENKGKKKA